MKLTNVRLAGEKTCKMYCREFTERVAQGSNWDVGLPHNLNRGRGGEKGAYWKTNLFGKMNRTLGENEAGMIVL